MWLVGNMTYVLSLINALTTMLPDMPFVEIYDKLNITNESQKVRGLYELAGKSRINDGHFPKDFMFGVATSAYQTEGAWNVSSKSPSIWDYAVHTNSSFIEDKSNADIAANSYYLYANDIELAKQVGSNAFRMSLSWARILPDGFINNVNKEAIQHYNDVINEILRRNITPVVTIYHWDLPQSLQELGGWTNPLIVDWFVDYARVVFDAFGDRVKYWITLNEPSIFCQFGYGGDRLEFAPRVKQSGVADYLCGHYALLAHAETYKLYQNDFQADQEGLVGITLSLSWPVPIDPTDNEQIEGAERFFQFRNGWFLNPIFTAEGDYPDVMKSRVDANSNAQGFSQSRLPKFTTEEIKMMKNSSDFLGVNFYYALSVRKLDDYDVKKTVSFYGDIGMVENLDRSPFDDRCTPWALSSLIRKLALDYDIPMMMVTENGYWDHGQLADIERAKYFHLHLNEVHKLIAEGIDIRGYFLWALIDNFEWTSGYREKFGLFAVDFSVPERPRTSKLSTKIISDIYKSQSIPDFLWSLHDVELDINLGT